MLFRYKDKIYPEYLKNGPGSRFISEFAKKYCKGRGINIGYGSEDGKIFQDNCLFLDILNGQDCNTLSLEDKSLDFVFSSHTLEHLNDWKFSLSNWTEKLKTNGVLFLYLPHPDMEYWRPENNKKHKFIIVPDDIFSFFAKLGFDPIFITGRDLYWSFCCVGFKK